MVYYSYSIIFFRCTIGIPYYSYGVLFVFHNIPQMYYWYSVLFLWCTIGIPYYSSDVLLVFLTYRTSVRFFLLNIPIGYCLVYEVFLLITIGDTDYS